MNLSNIEITIKQEDETYKLLIKDKGIYDENNKPLDFNDAGKWHSVFKGIVHLLVVYGAMVVEGTTAKMMKFK